MDPRRHRQTACDWQAMPQGPRGRFDTGQLVGRRMLGEAAPIGVVGGQFFEGKKALHRQGRIERHGRMPLGQDEPVAVGVVRACGVDAEHAPVGGREDVAAREARSQMGGLGGMAHVDDLSAQARRDGPQARRLRRVGWDHFGGHGLCA